MNRLLRALALPLVMACADESVTAPDATDVVIAPPVRVSAVVTSATPIGSEALPASCPPGTVVYDSHVYVKVVCGTARVVLDAPHDGDSTYAVPQRLGGTQVRDTYTAPLVAAMADSIAALWGVRPCTVTMLLSRTRVDANRSIDEGTDGNPEQERAWRNFHGFIDQCAAMAYAANPGGRVLLVDVHGQKAIARVVWGYRIGRTALNQPDKKLDRNTTAWRRGSMWAWWAPSVRHSQAVRGPGSLGGLFEARGYPSLPSPSMPKPGDGPYFNGDFIAESHGCRDAPVVSLSCAVQMETYRTGLRDTDASRKRYAGAAARALASFGAQ